MVPFVRTSLVAGGALAADGDRAGHGACGRGGPLASAGRRAVCQAAACHVARGVYRVTLPAEAAKADLEYYVQVSSRDGRELRFPAAAPSLCQTVVVVRGE